MLCCLFDLACFFLPSFSSLIKTCIHTCMHVHVLCCFALFVCLTLVASFFLLILKHVHRIMHMYLQLHVHVYSCALFSAHLHQELGRRSAAPSANTSTPPPRRGARDVRSSWWATPAHSAALSTTHENASSAAL